MTNIALYDKIQIKPTPSLLMSATLIDHFPSTHLDTADKLVFDVILENRPIKRPVLQLNLESKGLSIAPQALERVIQRLIGVGLIKVSPAALPEQDSVSVTAQGLGLESSKGFFFKWLVGIALFAILYGLFH